MSDIYYFGCREAGVAGHYLHEPGLQEVTGIYGRKSLRALTGIIDGLLLEACGVEEAQGRGVWTPLAGYMVLAWWDRTGDTRGGSNSAILLRYAGEVSWQEFVDRAKSAFPEIFARQKVPIVDAFMPTEHVIKPLERLMPATAPTD